MKIPADIQERVATAELQSLLEKVRSKQILTQVERKRLAEIIAEQDGRQGSKLPVDNVPALRDEGTPVDGKPFVRPTLEQRAARLDVATEWIVEGLDNPSIYFLAAKRWGIAQRQADQLIRDVRKRMSEPRAIYELHQVALQSRRLTKLYRDRVMGNDPRDPLPVLQELAALHGLNAPERTEQKLSTDAGTELAQVIILPHNGRDDVDPTEPQSEEPAKEQSPADPDGSSAGATMVVHRDEG